MAVERPRGEYAKSRARREAIVRAAVEVFSSVGFHKGSLREVADRAGLSQAGLLHHFPSKEHLLQAVLTWRDEDASQRLGTPTPEGLDLLRGMVDTVEHNASTPELVELHVVLSAEGTSPDHPMHDYFVSRYAAVFDIVLAAFRAADAQGQVRPDVDLHSAARTVIALMDGLQVQWLLHRADVDMAADLRRYLQSLLTVEL
jgi:AcrR family transcriptional regulator